MISVRGVRPSFVKKGKSRFADDRHMLGQALAVSAFFAVLTAILLVLKYNMASVAQTTTTNTHSSSSGGFVLVSSALGGGATRYRTATPLSFRVALDQLKVDMNARSAITSVIASSPHAAVYFEMPPVTASSSFLTPFEFVLLPSTSLVSGSVDTAAFAEHMSSSCNPDVAYFKNLGGDANLVVPCPREGATAVYGHLASFIRGGQADQVDEFWKTAASKALDLLSVEPLWISTNGNGVHFLHLRFDTRPKYYNYAAYKKFPLASS
jgi:hypothetical protein